MNGFLTAQLQAAIAAIASTVAGVPSIAGADAGTLATLQAQVQTAQGLSAQILAFYDEALSATGDPANFASGTDPAVMAGNVEGLLNANAGINYAFDGNNRLLRLGVNLGEIVAPSGQLSDIDHLFGNDVGVTPSGDIGLVSGAARTIQRVIRRLCTPSTKKAAPVTDLAVSAGEDLFRIAAGQYGDARGWALIAAANGLFDPVIREDQVLAIPAWNSARVNDGILPVPGETG